MTGKAGDGREPGGQRASDGSRKRKPEALPAIDFSTFVLSLSTTALYQMGIIPDPISGDRLDPNATIARQTIDTLDMLREKTRGNLDPEERKLIESLLYELRVKLVELDR